VDANRALGFADDDRGFNVASRILKTLGVANIQLMTNNPRKIKSLQDNGIYVISRTEIFVAKDEEGQKYLQTKIDRLGHLE
jgi:GTP cyclohydrolase II